MKTFIKNRKDQRIAVIVEEPQNSHGLVFVMHGLGGFKEQPQMQAMTEEFLTHGYTTVRFDTTNTQGESDGNYEDATITNYYEDLEDVIGWARTQSWFKKPFALAGHSLGGICTALFAEKHPEQVKAVAPISTVVSGKLSWETYTPKELEEWRTTGYRERISNSTKQMLRLKWANMEDRLKYDLLPEANKLTMPVLLAVGEQDKTTPLAQQKIFYEALPGQKEIHVITGAEHSFYKPENIAELKKIFANWLENIG